MSDGLFEAPGLGLDDIFTDITRSVSFTWTFDGITIAAGGSSWSMDANGHTFTQNGYGVQVLVDDQWAYFKGKTYPNGPYQGLRLLTGDGNAALDLSSPGQQMRLTLGNQSVLAAGPTYLMMQATSKLTIGDGGNTGSTPDVGLGRAALGVFSLYGGAGLTAGGTLGAVAYTPSQITSTQNNYASIHGRSLQVRLSSDAARTINGITAGVDGELHILRNVGSYNITFAHQSGSATGAQIYCDTVTDTCLEPGARALIEYDATSSRWCLSKFDNGQYRRYTPYGSWTFYDETGSYGAYIQNAFGGTVFQCQSGPKVTHADIDLAAQALNGGASHGSYDTAFQRVAAGVWGVGNGDDYNPGGAISFLPLSPSQITSNQTNYSAFIGGSKIVRVSTDALRELQGIAAGTDGVEHTLILTGSNNLTIKHNSGSATGKRIYCHGSADITLSPNDVVFLTFDSTTDVWRAWASNTALYDLRITATADPQTPIVITDPYANTLRLLCSSGNYQLLADGGQLRFACDDGGQTGFLAKNDGTVAYLSQGTSVGSIDGTHGLYLARGAFGGDASVPSQITSNQTSWDAGSAHPEDKEWVRFSTDADGREIQGMTAWSAHGYVREFVNVGSFTAVFKHASGSATGKQLRCSTGADITCGPNGVVRIRWDATSDVLRVMPLF